MSERTDVHRAGTILLASDAPKLSMTLRTALRRSGYAVVAVQDRAAARLRVDAALLHFASDIDAGLRLLGALRREEPTLPLVLVGPVQTHVRTAAQKHQAVLFYAPVEDDALMNALDRITAGVSQHG